MALHGDNGAMNGLLALTSALITGAFAFLLFRWFRDLTRQSSYDEKRTAVVNAPRERVFEILSDPAFAQRLDPRVAQRQRVPGTPVGKGEQRDTERLDGTLTREEVLFWRPPTLLITRVNDPAVRHELAFRLKRSGRGTRVTLHETMTSEDGSPVDPARAVREDLLERLAAVAEGSA